MPRPSTTPATKTFELRIETENEAFETPAIEVIRILRDVANRIEAGGLPTLDTESRPVRDINGNTCGECRWMTRF
jgi:hypothetical protein